MREFSISACSRARQVPSSLSPAERAQIPAYPHGPSVHYKQRDQGLYGRSAMRTGNIVSEKNEIKTRRVWRVNVHRKRLWSFALQEYVPVKLQARVIRTIDKVGGLDEYLLANTPGRIKQLGMRGWELRWRIMQTQAAKTRVETQLLELGLPSRGWQQQQREKRAEAVRMARQLLRGNAEESKLNLATQLEKKAAEAGVAVPELLAQAQQELAVSESVEAIPDDLDARISTAIASGQARMLLQQCEEESAERHATREKEHKETLRKAANRIWTEMRQRNDYRKSSGWEVALKRAQKQVRKVSTMTVADLTTEQWARLKTHAAQETGPDVVVPNDSATSRGLGGWLAGALKRR